MPARTVFLLTGVTATLALVACGQSATVLPTPTPVVAHASAPREGYFAPALFDVVIDPATLQATVAPALCRAASANDDNYLLSIAKFMRADTLQFTSIARDGDDLALTYQIKHPVPAPSSPEGPSSVSNRADLGTTGIACFLIDVDSATGNTFFTDRVANTDAFTDPDGYFAPEGLIPGLDTVLTANTFPFQQFVDESGDGSRIGISNGGLPDGNWGANAWTRDELGASRDQWTGYGVLHQGQTSERTIHLNGDALGDSIAFQVALIVHWADPRGGDTKDEHHAHRLPPDPQDNLAFAYRMPHGAWDVPKITFRGETGGLTPEASSATLGFHLEEWDLYATATIEPDLADEPNASRVKPGHGGFPALSICIPGVLGDATTVVDWNTATDRIDNDTAYGGDAGEDFGWPGDALFFARTLNKPAATSSGTFTGLFRAIDPSDADPASTFALAPDLTPLTLNLPHPVTYQACTVHVDGAGWARKLTLAELASVSGFVVDADGNTIVGGHFYSTYGADFGGGYHAGTGGAYEAYLVSYDPSGAFRWDRVFNGTGIDLIRDLTLDATGEIWATGYFADTIDLGAGTQTSVGNEDVFVFHCDATGTRLSSFITGGPNRETVAQIEVDLTGKLVMAGSSIEGSALLFNAAFAIVEQDSWLVRGEPDGSSALWTSEATGYWWARVNDIAIDSQNDAIFAGYYQDGLVIDGHSFGPLYSGDAFDDAWIAKFDTEGIYQWCDVFGSTDTGVAATHARGVAIGAGDTIYLVGDAAGLCNFGGGARPLTGDGFLVAYAPDGNWLADQTWASSSVNGIHRTAAGNLVLAGNFYQATDFGGGVRTPEAGSLYGAFLCERSASGTYRWDSTWTGPEQVNALSVAEAPDHSLRLSFNFSQTVDFDPGPATFEVTALFPGGDYAISRVSETGTW